MMKQVFTKNGIFNITNSLYESIIANNPEILLEDKDENRSEYRDYLWTNIETAVNNDNINDYKDLFVAVFNHLDKRGELSKGDNDVRFEDDLEKIKEKMAKENPKFKTQYAGNMGVETIDALGDIHGEKIKRENEIEKEKQAKQNKEIVDKSTVNDIDDGLINEDSTYKNVGDALNDNKLKQEIADSEQNAKYIVKRAKDLIQKYTGTWGSYISPNQTVQANQPQNTSNQAQQGSTQQVSSQQTPNVQTEAVENNGNNQVNYTLNSNKSDYFPNSLKNKNHTFGPRNAKSGLQLAMGGFRISPLFSDMGSQDAGKALKYYASAVKQAKGSRIKMMINTLLYYKNDKAAYQEIMNNKEGAPSTKEDMQKFEEMCYSYLHNVLYRVSINGEQEYNQLLNVIRMDPILQERYNITTVNTIQVLDAKEMILSYRNRSSDAINTIFVVTPLFAKGKEIMKGIKGVWDSMKSTYKV